MAWQLIYTSAPRLLEAGRSGFPTTAGIHYYCRPNKTNSGLGSGTKNHLQRWQASRDAIFFAVEKEVHRRSWIAKIYGPR